MNAPFACYFIYHNKNLSAALSLLCILLMEEKSYFSGDSIIYLRRYFISRKVN